MGLIKKVFGGIFAFIGGIFGGLFKGKKNEFFMELEEAAAPVLEAVEANTPSVPEAAKPAAAQADATLAKQKKAAPAAKKSAKSTTASQPPADLAQASSLAEATAPMSAPVKADMPTVKNFSTDYLVNPKVNRSPRRRPGPSVGPFKEMARDLKKSPSMG
ncbi:hypothetical protein PN498_03355 [Oscillatoria sp. CS-180]|uniref:hypothetical protein n=1 Tax=Oscillatoria sp. CS-180 TaxID=3021720 RepID=UPI00232F5EC0|nr:hypothetical protein [Oscillatoria sp. CS-180]MDB9525013.1 hypothetical protein [Oscillatoria sp. CS-180]